ncbi:cytochrome c-type biogenesis protein CcmH [Vibrio sp. TRT 17S01]|uniref:cytochrome c-type biogenesis protein CcmH n=1 Tax=Vibrio sp. TRT 17S01 TaxID=3418505 RepID=UPI003CEBE1ED
MKGFWIALVFTVLSIGSVNGAVDTEFVAADKAVVTQVELFEFQTPQIQQRAIALAKTLRCPQCQNQNLVESNSPIAKDLRLVVFEMMNQGSSEQEVVEYMTARFGDFVLYKPRFSLSNALLWGAPIILLILFLFFSWRRVRSTKQS